MSPPSSTDAFGTLLAKGLQADEANVRTIRIAAGEIIFKEGDPGDGMYVVDAGRLEIVLGTDDPEPRVIAHVGPGGIVGEMAVRLSTVQAPVVM